MNHLSLNDEHLRAWALRFMALLAADPQDQLAWLDGRELDTKDVIEEAELVCRISMGIAERGAFGCEELSDLRSIGRRLGEIDATSRAGLWDSALATDPAWEDIRSLSRRILLTSLGDWRQPLPRLVPPPPERH